MMPSLALKNARKLAAQKLSPIGARISAQKSFTIPTTGDPIILELFRLYREHAGQIHELTRRAGVYTRVFVMARKGRNLSLNNVTALLNVIGYELRIVRKSSRDPDADPGLPDHPPL